MKNWCIRPQGLDKLTHLALTNQSINLEEQGINKKLPYTTFFNLDNKEKNEAVFLIWIQHNIVE